MHNYKGNPVKTTIHLHDVWSPKKKLAYSAFSDPEVNKSLNLTCSLLNNHPKVEAETGLFGWVSL